MKITAKFAILLGCAKVCSTLYCADEFNKDGTRRTSSDFSVANAKEVIEEGNYKSKSAAFIVDTSPSKQNFVTPSQITGAKKDARALIMTQMNS